MSVRFVGFAYLVYFFISVSCPEGKANITPYGKKQSTLDDVFFCSVKSYARLVIFFQPKIY